MREEGWCSGGGGDGAVREEDGAVREGGGAVREEGWCSGGGGMVQ